jgi:glutamate mutase epsilon subunit
MKLRSELSEEMIKNLSNTNQPISLSYSNRKSSTNFDFTNSETEKIKNNLRDVVEKINSIQKLKIIR